MAHALESLLDKGRSGDLKIGGREVDVILEGTDLIKEAVRNVQDALADSCDTICCACGSNRVH